MNAGGTLLSVFGILTGFAYLGRGLQVLYNVPQFEKELEDDDALNNDDDNIYRIYISTLFVGFVFLITSAFMLYGSTKVGTSTRSSVGVIKFDKRPVFQRSSRHVFPYLIGILLSIFWSFVLGIIECFDSDMLLAGGYFAFAG